MCQEVTDAFGRLAQLGEHLPYKQEVTGSSPVAPTTRLLLLWPGSSVGLECQPVTLEVTGSSPVLVANTCWRSTVGSASDL